MILLDTCALVDLISPHPTFSNSTFELLEQGGMIFCLW